MQGSDSARIRVGFVGLGAMGEPMARVLAAAGTPLAVFDIDKPRAEALAGEIGARAASSPGDLGETSDLVITMLPNADIVRATALGGEGLDGLRATMAPGTVMVDMSSSYPIATRKLGAELAGFGIVLLDAPVSGGVRKAAAGALTIMLGGDEEAALARVTAVLEKMGTVFRTGPLGSGHALKALNNYVSAAGLSAACEAILVGRAFGLDPERMVDVINVSTGRNNSTEVKLKPFILSGEFRKAGFALSLMAKDVSAAADLADELGCTTRGFQEARDLWASASEALGEGADHTEIFSFLEARS